jgi:2-keto-3-deoxy-galactonokinase
VDNLVYLSGILIGGELAELARDAHSASPIAVCATGSLRQAYEQAAKSLGLAHRLLPIADAEMGRLASLGQACVARRLGVI